MPKGTHFPAKAKRVIYLFQAGGPSQFETLDPKPLLREKNQQPLPDSVRQGQRLTGMSGYQATLPLAGAFTNLSVSNAFSLGGGGNNNAKYDYTVYEIADDVDMVRGAHQITVGVNYLHQVMHVFNTQYSNGQFTFDGSVTGEITVRVTPAGQRFAAVQNCPSAI